MRKICKQLKRKILTQKVKKKKKANLWSCLAPVCFIVSRVYWFNKAIVWFKGFVSRGYHGYSYLNPTHQEIVISTSNDPTNKPTASYTFLSWLKKSRGYSYCFNTKGQIIIISIVNLFIKLSIGRSRSNEWSRQKFLPICQFKSGFYPLLF